MLMTPRTATAPAWFTVSSKDSRIFPWNLKQVIYTAQKGQRTKGHIHELFPIPLPFNKSVPMFAVVDGYQVPIKEQF